jgi:hypothetical protein
MVVSYDNDTEVLIIFTAALCCALLHFDLLCSLVLFVLKAAS